MRCIARRRIALVRPETGADFLDEELRLLPGGEVAALGQPAVLGLLAGAAEERPLVCLVDDAQWLDDGSMQVLAFVARRLVAESVALVFALRDSDGDRDPAGLPELTVQGLSEHHARALPASAVVAPLDPLARDRIVAEAHGNPMALLHLPRVLAPGELAGGFWPPGARLLTCRIENAVHQQVRSLPDDSRRLLLTRRGRADRRRVSAVVRCRPAGDREGRRGGGRGSGARRVRRQGVLRPPARRAAVYRGASAPDRRAAHRALAEATDPRREPDRRAWHRAHATPEPDEDIAADLERSACRAQGRGGTAAAASFLRQAAELTPDPAHRVARVLAAAQFGIDAPSSSSARARWNGSSATSSPNSASPPADSSARRSPRRGHGRSERPGSRPESTVTVPGQPRGGPATDGRPPACARPKYSDGTEYVRSGLSGKRAGRLGPCDNDS
ncbi:hypothetical protein [Streptomyces sp. NPDC019507]|uniref:hypothetical protein n=1 Tax=Streptomyces sp. NPDC019507 TaxID=3154689 RepID=UPI0033FFD9E7